MPITINGTGTIAGVSSTGLSAAQNVVRSQLPTGSVLQVVNFTTTSTFSTNSTSFVDATGYSVSITPNFSTSKILVIANLYAGSTANFAAWFNVVRNSTTIAGAVSYSGQGSNAAYATLCDAITYLDSPATTSSVTYKIQAKSDNPSATIVLGGATNQSFGGGTALNTNSITLLEIAG